MRRTIAAAVLGLATALLVASPSAAYAASYLDEAVQALQTGNVYISPEVRTIDAGTRERLEQQTHDTGIGVVVLPQGASTEAGDIPQFVVNITRDSGKETVIVAVGGDLEAASRTMQKDAASKLANDLERSNPSTGDALVKFVTEVRSATSADSPQTNAAPDFSGIGIVVGIVAALAAGGGFFWVRSKRKPQGRVVENATFPQSIRELLSELSKYTTKRDDSSKTEEYSVDDDEMRSTLTEAISNTNELFVRLVKKNESRQFETAMAVYGVMLPKMASILHTYVDVQNNEKFFREPTDSEWREKTLQYGKDAVSKYANGVLNNIREIHRGTMTDFYADTALIEQKFNTD